MPVARKPSCRDASAFFYQIKGNLTEIQPKNHQNVQKTPFSPKAPEVNGLRWMMNEWAERQITGKKRRCQTLQITRRLLRKPYRHMTSNGSTLTKCPSKNTGLLLSKFFKDSLSNNTKDILVRAKFPKWLLHVDKSCVGLPCTLLLSLATCDPTISLHN